MTLKVGRSIACLGSKSSHGGIIITATGGFTVNGIRAAVAGDLHLCPISGHGTKALISSSTNTSLGKSILKVGDRALCGAVITTGPVNALVCD